MIRQRLNACIPFTFCAVITAPLFAGCAPPPAATITNPGEAGTGQQPVARGRLDNLNVSAEALLKNAPGIVALEIRKADRHIAHRVVHFLDVHFVSDADFAADVRSQNSDAITDAEITDRYEAFLRQVDEVQQEQMAVIRHLIRNRGLNHVYVEGLTDPDVPIFNAMVTAQRKLGDDINQIRNELEQFASEGSSADSSRLLDDLRELERSHHIDLLRLGAVGRLLVIGERIEVRPLEDEKLYVAANPVRAGGKLEMDEASMKARRLAQSERLLVDGPLAFVILGAAHDLGDDLMKLSQNSAEYVRVETHGARQISRHLARHDTR